MQMNMVGGGGMGVGLGGVPGNPNNLIGNNSHLMNDDGRPPPPPHSSLLHMAGN